MGRECEHRETEFGRVLWADGGGYHVQERCKACGVNVRGPGRRVPRGEIDDPDSLPAFGDRQNESQPTLFREVSQPENER